MKFLSGFLTHTPSQVNFQNFGILHITIIFIALVCMRLSYRKEYSRRFERNMVILIALNQIVLYLWYITGDEFIQSGLPLYTCRIADILIVAAYVLDNRFIRALGIYLGFIGGVIAIITPALYDYRIYHYANINFFMSHIALMSISMYYFMQDDGYFIKIRNKVMKYTFIILMIISVINKIIGSNYSYTESPPFLNDLFSRLTWIEYFVILICMYEISILLQSLIFSFFEKEKRSVLQD